MYQDQLVDIIKQGGIEWSTCSKENVRAGDQQSSCEEYHFYRRADRGLSL
jgi:hypothetical protein